ncbi:hypothetical protein EXU34_22720 [Alteromonas sp. ZYF713]|nr:hypothetical protein [Alteromonas sp. ZYF713]
MKLDLSRTPSTDIICPMYMRIWDCVKIAKDPNETRPLILCEYSHAMGNSNGNIHQTDTIKPINYYYEYKAKQSQAKY